MNEEHDDQQLAAAYRHASDREAGRPDAMTRAAILAAAAAAARRRTPAANASHYLLRAVAGVAVIGVGLLVWRQTEHRLPGEGPALDVPVAQQTVERAADPAFVPAPAAPTPAAPTPSPEVQLDMPPVRLERVVPPAAAEVGESTQAAPPPPPPPSVASRDTSSDEVRQVEMEEVQVTGARILREQRIEASGAELLQQYFPTQHQSGTPRRVWLVRDADGAVLGTGELRAAEPLQDQFASIRRALEVEELAMESVQSVPNARGQLVELTILLAR